MTVIQELFLSLLPLPLVYFPIPPKIKAFFFFFVNLFILIGG